LGKVGKCEKHGRNGRKIRKAWSRGKVAPFPPAPAYAVINFR